jgi:hypothetical protein
MEIAAQTQLTEQNVAPIVICKRMKAPPQTADAFCIAIDDATQNRYLCKDQTKEHWLPIVEWLAQHLAARCGLLVPDCYVVQLATQPDKLMFGSKWEGGAEAFFHGILEKITNPSELSAIFAFDLLIHNVDRHLNNYLYLQLAGDTVVKAMDHSRCLWFSGWPLPSPPPENNSNTMRNAQHWKTVVQWDKTRADEVVLAWSTITKEDITAIFEKAPSVWTTQQQREDFQNWWGSSDWQNRTDEVVGAFQ